MVVVHYADRGATGACLQALEADPSPVARRIAVVDNSAAGPGALAAAELPPGVVYVPSPDNPGFGEGANRGAARLSREGSDPLGYLILNHDVEVAPGFLAAAARAVAEPGIGAAGGPLYGAPSGALWYAGGGLRRATGTVWQSRAPADAARRRTVGFLPGTAIVVAPEAWREVGGFDPGFFLYHEDLDLCLRLRRAGWSLLFEPGMAAVHHLGGATGSAERSALYLEQMARTRFRPHRSRLYRLYLAAIHTPYVGLRALFHALGGGSGGRRKAAALLRGHAAALRTVW